MADVAQVLAKVRSLGADVVLERDKMKIVDAAHLSTEQRAWLADHRAGIEEYLRQARKGEEPPPAEVDTPPRTWTQFARVLYAGCPDGRDPYDWSYFVTEFGKVVRQHYGVDA